MAQYSLRLRRFLSLSSSLLHQQQQQFQYIRAVSPFISSFSSPSSSNQNPENPSFSFNSKLQFFRSFRSSAPSYRNPRSIDDEEIGPDTILFKGCDYNHWLITMDLPKDYTPEQMVEAYVRAATQVFGSEEEAKKKIYACSTSVYIGFQVECSEETSEKFKEVEGVVFVLPDSYIDPVNNEYGGDKYVNGTIIPRPPPIQYGRREGRFNDRRPRVQNRGPMQGDNRNFGPPQNPPSHQNYGPVGGQPPHLSNVMPQNPATPGPQQNYSPAGVPPTQQNHGMPTNHPAQAPQQNYVPQRNPQGQYSGQLQNSPPGPSYGQQQNSSPGYNYGRQQNSSAGYNYGQPQNSSPGYNYSQPQNSSPGYNYGQSQNHPPQHGPSFTGHQNFGTSGAVNNGPTSASGVWNDYQSGRRDFQQQDQRGYPSADHGSNRGLGGSRQDMNAAYGNKYSNNAEEPRFSQSGYGNNMHGGEQRHHDTADGVDDQQHRY